MGAPKLQMFISKKICYLELEKTAISSIREFLKKNISDGKITGVHNFVTNELINNNLFFVGSIRNPLDWYISRWSMKNFLSAIYLSRAVIVVLFLLSSQGTIAILMFSAALGFTYLSTVPPTNGIVAQIFGTKYLSTLFGIVFLCHQFGAFLGAYLGGYFYDLYGSYDYAWYIAIALSIFATLVHYPINETPLKRKFREA